MCNIKYSKGLELTNGIAGFIYRFGLAALADSAPVFNLQSLHRFTLNSSSSNRRFKFDQRAFGYFSSNHAFSSASSFFKSGRVFAIATASFHS
jgi:hypothetical protein